MKKTLLLIFGIVIVYLCLGFSIYQCNEERNTFYQKQCISPTALKGCEQAGFDVESQLRRCEYAFERCVQANEVLKEKIKEKTNGSDN